MHRGSEEFERELRKHIDLKKLEKMKNDRDALTRKFDVLKKGISQQSSPHGGVSKSNKQNLPNIKVMGATGAMGTINNSPRSIGETVWSGETWETMSKQERDQAMGKKAVNELNIISRDNNPQTTDLLISNYLKQKRKDHMKSSKLSPFMAHSDSALCVNGDVKLGLSPSHNFLPPNLDIVKTKKGDERKKEDEMGGYKKKVVLRRPTHIKPDEYLKPAILKNKPEQKEVKISYILLL